MTVAGLHAVWTALLFVVFLFVVWWAFRRPNRSRFEAAAHIPLKDDQELDSNHV